MCKRRVGLMVVDTCNELTSRLVVVHMIAPGLLSDISPARVGLMTFDTNAQYRVSTTMYNVSQSHVNRTVNHLPVCR